MTLTIVIGILVVMLAGIAILAKAYGIAGSGQSMAINALGAVATGLTALVVLVAKFTEGAWITLLLIPGLMLSMRLVRGHYNLVARETRTDEPVSLTDIAPPLVVPPELVVVKSPYRFVIRPIIDYAIQLEKDNPHRQVTVLLAQLVESSWYYALYILARLSVYRRLVFRSSGVSFVS